MYWLSMKFIDTDGDDRHLTPHLGTKRDAKIFFNFLVDLLKFAHYHCKVKLFKNTEVIARADI